MGLRTHIADAEQRVLGDLALDREEIIFVIRISVKRFRRCLAVLRKERPELLAGIGVTGCLVQRRKRERIRIAEERAVPSRHVRLGAERRRRTGVAQAIRRLWLVDRHDVALDHGLEDAVARADAGLAGTADDFIEKARRAVGRPREADARRKAVLRRYERVGNAGIAGIDEAYRRVGIND